MNANVNYDTILNIPATYLIAHNAAFDTSDIKDHSIVVDPWRSFATDNNNIKIIHYGNTRIARQ